MAPEILQSSPQEKNTANSDFVEEEETEMTEEELQGWFSRFAKKARQIKDKIKKKIKALTTVVKTAAKKGKLTSLAKASIKRFVKAAVKKGTALLQSITSFRNLVRKLFPSFAQIIRVAKKFHFDWQLFISAMLHSYVPKDVKPESNNRIPAMRHAALLINNVLPKAAVVSNTLNQKTTFNLDKVQGYKNQNFYPLSWSVPAKGAAHWLMRDQQCTKTKLSGRYRISLGWMKRFLSKRSTVISRVI